MLKEAFLIDQGMLIFHYAKNREESESDEAILSSGLLMAIRDFSHTTRADEVESFNTEKEYFLFAGMAESNVVLVGVFDKRAPTQVAHDALMRIREYIETVRFPEVEGQQLDSSKKEAIRIAVEEIVVSSFGVENVAAYMDDLLGSRNDISIAFVVNISDRRALAHFARPAPLYSDEQVRQFLLVHDTLCRTISKISPNGTYRSFIVEADGYVIGGCWSGNRISVATGAMQTGANAVIEVAGQLCNTKTSRAVVASVDSLHLVTRARVKQSGTLVVEEGASLPGIAGVFLSTVVNNLDAFVRIVSHRRLSAFRVHYGTDPDYVLFIQPHGDEIEMNIYTP